MAEIDKIIREKGDELLAKQNVVGVAKGRKNEVGEEAVVVLVKSKVSADNLSDEDLVPAEIEGRPTDVIEVGEITVNALHTKKERPVYGGLSCIWEKGTSCTLGAVVYRNGERFVLTNTHCVNPFWQGAKVGDEMRQPSPRDGGKDGDRIGVSTEHFEEIKFDGSNNLADAGLGLIDKEVEIKAQFQEGIGDISDTPRTVQVGERVRKSGRTTGATESIVILTNATIHVNFGEGKLAKFVGQTISENKDKHFSAPGDSGSLILDGNNNPVGLNFAGSDTIEIFSPIKPIVEKYQITFSDKPYQKPKFIFTQTLHIGAFGDEVIELQARLRELGFFKYPSNTGYFGTITEQAVKDYQCARGIVCEGNWQTTGYGQVGRLTRASLNGEETQPEVKLLPLVERMKEQLKEIMKASGEEIIVTSGFRTFEEQDALYAIGRTKEGAIVTNAKGGESLHNFRVAFDIAFVVKGASLPAEAMSEGISEDFKNELIESSAIHYNGDWEKVGRIGKALGLDWGGDWTTFVDRPHFEYLAGYTLKDFQDKTIDESKFDDYL